VMRAAKIIPNAFGERPVLKLMYPAVIRAAERWRGIAVGEFEQRHLRTILRNSAALTPNGGASRRRQSDSSRPKNQTGPMIATERASA